MNGFTRCSRCVSYRPTLDEIGVLNLPCQNSQADGWAYWIDHLSEPPSCEGFRTCGEPFFIPVPPAIKEIADELEKVNR